MSTPSWGDDMSREEPQINIRVTTELKAKIKSRAQRNGRSMNAEIVKLLEDAVSTPAGMGMPPLRPSDIDAIAQQEADKFKAALVETLKTMYGKDKS